MSQFFIKLFQESSFLGALLGATITGGLALYINSFQHKKESQKELNESQKVLLIFHYYSKVMNTSFNSLNANFDEYESIDDPYSQIEFYTDDDGNEHTAYFPSGFEIKEYEAKVKPLIEIIKRNSESILEEFEKVNSVNIYSLKLRELDSVLKFLGTFKSTIEPKFKEIIKSDYPSITLQERDAINRIFEGFNNITKTK